MRPKNETIYVNIKKHGSGSFIYIFVYLFFYISHQYLSK